MSSFDFSFLPPDHGWLPVHVSAGAIAIEFDASDVPNDPVQELIRAIDSALRSQAATVWWHVEPAGYYFDFHPHELGVQLRVSFVADGEEPEEPDEREEVLVLAGTKLEILIPIWRALQSLQELNVQEPHWPPVDWREMQAIEKTLTGNLTTNALRNQFD